MTAIPFLRRESDSIDTPAPEAPVPAPTAAPVTASKAGRRGQAALVIAIGVGLAFVIAAPMVLSSTDLVRWASSPDGLNAPPALAWFVFIALDVAAAVCVGMVVYSAWRGESGGVFGLLVWAFAGASAYANFRHGQTTAARDDDWFYPAMSLAGPALLEATTHRVRRWVNTSAGRYERPLPHFRVTRWLVAPRETGRSWRLAVTEGYSRPEEAVEAARALRGKGRHARPEAEGQPEPPAPRPVTPRPVDPNPDVRPVEDVPLPGPEIEGDPGDEDEAADRAALDRALVGLRNPARDRALVELRQVPFDPEATQVLPRLPLWADRDTVRAQYEASRSTDERPQPRPASVPARRPARSTVTAGTHRHAFDQAEVERLVRDEGITRRSARRRLSCVDPQCPDRKDG